MKKNILLVASHFYGYDRLIQSKLNEMDYNVLFLNYWSPFRKLKIDVFLPPRYALKIHAKWLMYKLSRLDIESLDYLLVIKGTTLQPVHLEYIFKRNPTICKIMYQWDSVSLFNYLPLTKFFDKIFTFDMADARNYSFIYLPLFCAFPTNKIIGLAEDIDLLLIGSYNRERYNAAIHFYRLCQKYKFVFKCMIYIPFSVYIAELIKGNRISMKLCRFTPISMKDVVKYYQRSRAFLDVISSSQQGYSMRTIECYGFNKKLITSNHNICLSEDLADMETVSLDVSGNEFDKFMQSPTKEYPNKWKFSLDYFLKFLLNRE